MSSSPAIRPWLRSSSTPRDCSSFVIRHLPVRLGPFGIFLPMKRKRLIVMGFMGSCPIAGVIWQHIHYIVGLQRLGHDVFYIEDSARLPYNPATLEVNNEFDYAAKILERLATEFDFKRRWSFCARYLPGNPTAGLP